MKRQWAYKIYFLMISGTSYRFSHIRLSVRQSVGLSVYMLKVLERNHFKGLYNIIYSASAVNVLFFVLNFIWWCNTIETRSGRNRIILDMYFSNSIKPKHTCEILLPKFQIKRFRFFLQFQFKFRSHIFIFLICLTHINTSGNMMMHNRPN